MPKRKLVNPSNDEVDLPTGKITSKKQKRSTKNVEDQELAVTAEVAENGQSDAVSPGRGRKRRQVKVEQADERTEEVTPKKQRQNQSQPAEKLEDKSEESGEATEKKVVKKRKSKKDKDAEAMPLAARTAGHKLYIGAHVSAAGGAHKAVLNSIHIGANAFALFLKSQRKWANPPLAEDVADSFHSQCKEHAYDASRHIVPHGSYLVNLAHTDKERTKQAYDAFLDDLKRCERLGIKLYNFHPGNSVGNDRDAAIQHLAANLNRAHKETSTVVTLLENMAAGGNVLGSTFEDLRDTIALIDDKSRVGVCIDTCHTFAAGYDLRSPEAFKQTMHRFDEVVGFKYLRALHINDSKAPFDSHRDLHANIGTGFLGLRAFHNVVNEPRFVGLPLVLETPLSQTDEDGEPLKDDKGKQKEDASTWAGEIKMLESLVGMDVESDDFKTLEKTLAKKGEKERNRLSAQAERKKEKEAKKSTKGSKKKNTKGKSGNDDSDLSELSDDDSEA